MNDVLVGLDIGSSKVCTILGQLNKNNQLQFLGVGTSQCKGIKKGTVVDIDSVAQAIKESVKQAERMSGMEIESVFINMPGGHASLVKNRGVIAVPGDDREITREDVERVLQEVKIGNISIDREVIGVIPLQFIVDGNENIKDPVGMVGVRLEVEAYIVTAVTSVIQNLVRCVERCGIEVVGVIIDPLASGEVILTKDEKELGIALVDVGGETCDISVFINSTLVHTRLIPVGGNYITNDISIGLKIAAGDAEQLKRQYGYASVSMVDEEESITVGSPGQSRKIKGRELADIIEARIQEIFHLIKRELEVSDYEGRIPGGVVITGGGVSFIKGASDAASSIIGLPVRIGAPKYIGVASPVYSTAAGMIKYIISNRRFNTSSIGDGSLGQGKQARRTRREENNLAGKVKSFFADFF